MKGLVLLTLAAAMCTICGRPNTSKAAETLSFGSNLELQNIQLERRVQRLENEVNRTQRALEQFHHRLSELERKSDDGWQPRPPRHETVHSCMIVDSGFTKTFLGKASTQIDAQFEAKRNCEKAVHSTYCKMDKAKCDSNLDDPRVQSYVCVVVDKGFQKVFRGEGQTRIEAEAKAKQSCQQSVHPSYCGKVTASCEASYIR